MSPYPGGSNLTFKLECSVEVIKSRPPESGWHAIQLRKMELKLARQETTSVLHLKLPDPAREAVLVAKWCRAEAFLVAPEHAAISSSSLAGHSVRLPASPTSVTTRVSTSRSSCLRDNGQLSMEGSANFIQSLWLNEGVIQYSQGSPNSTD